MKAKWTVMIYMAGDDDLDPAALDDIAELYRVGSSEEVNILVQLDRDKDLMTRRFRITKGGGYRKDCIETFGETNSGDPKVLLLQKPFPGSPESPLSRPFPRKQTRCTTGGMPASVNRNLGYSNPGMSGTNPSFSWMTASTPVRPPGDATRPW
jgi:hypothetical protein